METTFQETELDMDKAKAKKAYKETRRPMGIYRIRDVQNGTSYIGASTDLAAIINRHKAELKFGTHRNAELRDVWRASGESRLTFEILDELSHRESSQENPAQELGLLLQMWIGKLEDAQERVVGL